MSEFFELLKKENYRFMSIWIQTIMGPVVTAVLYQLIFGRQFAHVSSGFSGVNYAAFLIPGLVMMQVILNAESNASSSLIQSKYNGNIIFILMAPITPFSIYSAYLVSSITRGVVTGAVVFLGICWFGAVVPHCIWSLIYFLIFGAVISGGIGVIIGILSNKFDQLAAFQSFLMTPLVYLAGVFFNPGNLSSFWQKVAFLNPFLYLVDGFRYGFIGHSSTNIVVGAVFVFIMAFIINLVGFILMKKGIKIKR